MLKFWMRAVIVSLLLLIPSALFAQGDDEEMPEIPYYRASSNFNVPILELEGWANQSTRDTALFANENLSAKIQVTAVSTLDDSAAIRTALSSLYEGDIAEPVLESRIGIANGTWTQQLFSFDDTSISAFALVRGDRTFVVTLIEDSAEYDVHQFAIRSPILGTTDAGEVQTDFAGGIDLAVQTVLGADTTFTLEDSVNVHVIGLASVQNQYSTAAANLSVFAQEFDGIIYATISTGAIETSTQIGAAMETVFLGFFITPDNSNYLYLALTVVALIFSTLISSMWLRYVNVKKDMALVAELVGKA